MKIVSLLLVSFLIFTFTTFSQWTQVGGNLTGIGQSPRISVVDSNVVWVAGGFGTTPTIYRSVDGGVNWNSIPTTGLPYFLSAIAAKDSVTAFVADVGSPTTSGGNAKLYKTTNAGLNWTVIDSTGGTTGFYNDIQFSKSNPQFGIAMSDPANGPGGSYIVNKTTDGGITWVKTNPPGVPNSYGIFYDAYAIDPQFYGFASWNNPAGKVYSYTTSDGGSNWFLGDSGVQVIGWGDIVFNDDKQHGVMVGAEWPNIKVTSNGGINWVTVNTGTDIYGFSTASWVCGTNVVFICANLSSTNPGIIRSDDNGLTWQQQETPALGKKEIENVRHGNAIYGYVITTDGAVLKSVQSVNPDTLHVPADYPSIQSAIDAAMDGNTILVADGTYYENINYKGKAITVASHFLVDGDSTHIENTIINGSQAANPDSGSVVYFVSGEDTSSVLCGFTITGGTGTYLLSVTPVRKYGGGICAVYSGMKVKNNIIEFNVLDHPGDVLVEGGGIGVGSSDSINCIIEGNIIRNNSINSVSTTYVCQGGGIRALAYGNLWIINNIICDNTVTGRYAYDGGISFNDFASGLADKWIVSNIISGNEVIGTVDRDAGGMSVYHTSVILKNNLIVNNSAENGGGLLIETTFEELALNGRSGITTRSEANHHKFNALSRGASVFENNTIVDNIADEYGGGIYIIGPMPHLMNFILWGNEARVQNQVYGAADIQYSNVEGGHVGTGNIDEDPQFVLNNKYYILEATSPCVDAGNPDPMYFDVGAGGNALPPAHGSVINDMGHCGGPGSLWYMWDWPMPVEDELSELSEYALMQNYPNPFNPITTIKYGIPERSFVELKVYDILGNEISSLVNQELNAGYYELNFNAASLSSGVYFYQLKAGSYIQTKKMLLLK